MSIKEAMDGRRSIRKYLPREVPKEMVMKLIEAGETAPSAGNLRARKYVIVTGDEMKRALSLSAYGQSQVETAPVLIVACADVGRSSARYGDRGSLYSIQDATASVMCILLAAHDLGLGACWVGAFDDQATRDILGMGEGILPVAILSIGYPAEAPVSSSRRGLEDMVSWVE